MKRQSLQIALFGSLSLFGLTALHFRTDKVDAAANGAIAATTVDKRPIWTPGTSWVPPIQKVVDGEDGSAYFEQEMKRSGCEDTGSALLVDSSWTGINDVLAFSDAAVVVTAGDLEVSRSPMTVGFTVQEVIWDRKRVKVPRVIQVGTQSSPTVTSGMFVCSAPLPKAGTTYLAFVAEIDGQWWLPSASEGLYELRGNRLLRMNGGRKGPWLILDSVDKSKQLLAAQPTPADLNQAGRGLPKLPPTSAPTYNQKLPEEIPPTTVARG
jgi:hypothetical protein